MRTSLILSVILGVGVIYAKSIDNSNYDPDEYYKEVQEALDSKVDPCTNFMEYACGTTKKTAFKDQVDFVTELLASESKNSPEFSASIDKIRTFQNACENDEASLIKRYFPDWPYTEMPDYDDKLKTSDKKMPFSIGDIINNPTSYKIPESLRKLMHVSEAEGILSTMNKLNIETGQQEEFYKELASAPGPHSPQVVLNYVIWKNCKIIREEDCLKQAATISIPIIVSKYRALIASNAVQEKVDLLGDIVQKYMKDSKLQETANELVQQLKLSISHVSSAYSPSEVNNFYESLHFDKENHDKNVEKVINIIEEMNLNFLKKHCENCANIEPTLVFPLLLKIAQVPEAVAIIQLLDQTGVLLMTKDTETTNLESLFEDLQEEDKSSLCSEDLAPITQEEVRAAVRLIISQARTFFRDYKNMLNDARIKPSPTQLQKYFNPDLHINEDKMFFINFVQPYCSFNKAQKEDSIYREGLANLKEFADTFQCSATSPMNHRGRC